MSNTNADLATVQQENSKTKQEQYRDLREIQKQKYQEKENIRRGGAPLGSQARDGDPQEDLDALEKMDLDRKADDSKMYDQFNPMAGSKQTGL